MARTIRIDRQQRDAIYQEVVVDLGGTGDIRLKLDKDDFEAAQRLRRRYEESMRLLDDLGWEPEPDGDEFEITMDRDSLARALRRFNDSASDTLQIYVVEPIEGDFVVRAVQAQAACGDVLAQLAGIDDEDRQPDDRDDNDGGEG